MEDIITLNESTFFEALRSSNKLIIKKFLKSNIEIWNFTESEDMNNTALHIAAMGNLSNILKFILLEIIESNSSFNTILTTWFNRPNIKGDLPIHYLSFKGNIEIIKLLTKYNLNLNIGINTKNKQGNNVLHYAAQGNQPITFIYFLHKGNLNPEEENIDGSTPLHWACFSGTELCQSYIMKYIKNINKQDKDGLTALHLAIISENTYMVKELLKSGANKNIKDNKARTPLDLAIEKEKDQMIELLKSDIICSLVILRNPVSKLEKSSFNIIVYVFSNLLSLVHMLIFLLPFFNSPYILFIYLTLLLFNTILYSYLLYLDPGEKKNNDKDALYKFILEDKYIADFCPKCSAKIISGIKHCNICNTCVDTHDHHCYWINKCVGKGNIKQFRVFLLSTIILIIYCFIFSLISK